jgi:hypothetical protein
LEASILREYFGSTNPEQELIDYSEEGKSGEIIPSQKNFSSDAVFGGEVVRGNR